MADNEVQPEHQEYETPAASSNELNDLASEFGDLFAKRSAPEPTEAQAAEKVEAQPAPTPAATVETPKEAPLSPLLAERSRREREMRAELEQSKSAVEAAREQAKQELIHELFNDTQNFIMKYGKDRAGDLALHAYAVDLGDDAPPDLRQQLGVSELDQFKRQTEERFQALQLERQQAVIEAENRATISQYQGFISTVPDSMPFFASEAQADENEALRTMALVADHIRQESGQYPSASEVASIIERTLSETAARYNAVLSGNTQKPAAVTPAQQTVQVETPTNTLSNENTGQAAHALPVGEDECFKDAFKLLDSWT